MMTTNKTTTIAEAKQQKKTQEQERATFRPAAKTITKAGGATCCCCYCCCHKPQHNSKVYATHNGKLHKSAAQHNCQQQGGGNGREGERSDVIGSRARHQIIVCRMLQLLLLLLPLFPLYLFLQLQQNLIASRCTGHAYKWAAPATATEKCLPHSQKLIKLKVNALRAP